MPSTHAPNPPAFVDETTVPRLREGAGWFHNCHSPVTTLVSAAVAATSPSFLILEIDQDDAPWRDDVLTHPLTIKDGCLKLPKRPGLGSDLIEAELLGRPWRIPAPANPPRPLSFLRSRKWTTPGCRSGALFAT